jgi:hypothetical protein
MFVPHAIKSAHFQESEVKKRVIGDFSLVDNLRSGRFSAACFAN